MSATGFPAAARAALSNAQRRRNLGKATSTIRAKRAAVAGELPDWQALRDAGVCVVEAGQVVAGVPDAIAALAPRAPLTFVSGPSATSDIELERVEGVHGPRRLEGVVVG